MRDHTAVLLIGYQRLESIKTILEIIKRNRVPRVYISIDAPKLSDQKGMMINNLIRKYISDFKKTFEGEIIDFYRLVNRGCAASVVSSCNWVFTYEKYAIVLEDDCIPEDSFFHFVYRHMDVLDKTPNVVMVSGTQLAPREITEMKTTFSGYPMIWGWASTRDKWNLLSQSFKLNEKRWPNSRSVKAEERAYWDAGVRRSLNGYIDAWDIVVARFMQRNNFLSILPPVPYISNIGLDDFATHTTKQSSFLFRRAEELVSENFPLRQSQEIDHWIKKNVYGVSTRHLVSTKITWALDCFRSKSLAKLQFRIEAANRDFNQ